MSTSIELKDNQKYVSFVIENESSQPLPVQISLYERGMKETGEDILTETSEIAAFPDQLIIPPEQKRSVKVSWNGKAEDLKTEKAFRFVAEQLPLDLDKKNKNKTGIKMLLKYVAALYVNPKGSEENVLCEYENLQLLCSNEGNKHKILNFKNLSLDDGKSKVELTDKDLIKVSGENILANSKRVFPLNKSELKKLQNPVKVNFKLE
jgi:fimbrial chaperone protein